MDHKSFQRTARLLAVTLLLLEVIEKVLQLIQHFH